jgi:hypothetical protein
MQMIAGRIRLKCQSKTCITVSFYGICLLSVLFLPYLLLPSLEQLKSQTEKWVQTEALRKCLSGQKTEATALQNRAYKGRSAFVPSSLYSLSLAYSQTPIMRLNSEGNTGSNSPVVT